MLRPPPELPPEGILVGYSLEHERHTAPIGFVYGDDGRARRAAEGGPPEYLTPILHTGGGHLLTIAPTGAGKGVSCIIPTLLRFPGPVIVIDPKGENAAVTGERRRAMGQEVVILDPMGITGTPSPSSLNPLDLIDPEGAQSIDDASMLASLLSGGIEREDPRNLFWYQRGEQLLTGLIQYVATEADEERRNLSEVRSLLNLPIDDFIEFSRHHMGNAEDPDVRQIAGTLINPAQEMIGSIVGMAQNSLGFLRGELLHRSTARSSFDLDGITHGDPLSIYLVIPPDKLQSHRNLLRVWVGTLMAALMRRRAPVKHNTLFILDEAAQLGPLEQLRQAITLLRGYGLQTWSFWQDHSQLSNLYPMDWQTMFNNCRVHQAFGFTTLQAANAISELSGFHDALEALRLDTDEMLLSVSGDETVIAQKPSYLTDPAFQGLYADNPFYKASGERPPAPRRSQRRYRRPRRDGQEGEEGAGEAGGTREPEEAGEGPDDEYSGEAMGPAEVDEALRGLGGSTRSGGEGEDAPPARGRFGFRELEEPGPRDAALRIVGGLSPMIGTDMFEAGEVPGLLEAVERELGQRWHRYRTLVRWNYLRFFRQFYLCELHDPARVPAREFLLRQKNDLRLFTGGTRPLAELVREAGLKDEADSIVRYAVLHLHFTRGRDPRVQVVESVEQLAYWTGRPAEELGELAERIRPAGTRDDLEGTRLVEGTALVEGRLCAFRVPVRPDGAVGRLTLQCLQEDAGPAPRYEREVTGSPELASIHGPWEIVEGPERGELLDFLPRAERQGADAGLPLHRRPLPCYPGMELIRVPPATPGGEPVFLLWGGARPTRVTARDRESINARFLAIDGPRDAELCMRLYGWLRSGPDYPIALLDEPVQLLGLLEEGAELDPERLRGIEEGWVPMTVEGEVGDDGPLFRFRFTLVEGRKLVIMTATMGPDGELKSATEEALADDLPVDPARLEGARSLPQLGDPARYRHDAEEGVSPAAAGAEEVSSAASGGDGEGGEPREGSGVGGGTGWVEAVLGIPELAPLHGPWESLTPAELRSLLFALGVDEPPTDPPGAFLRRRLPCFPGLDLLRLSVRGPDGPPDFLAWGGGRPLPVSMESLPRLNGRFLSIDGPGAMEAYVRFFTWLRSSDDYPVTLLGQPGDLEALLGSGLDRELGGRIREGWVSLTCEPQDPDGEVPVYRAEFMLLEGRRLLAMEVDLGADGGIRNAMERVLADDLPVDPDRLAAARSLPALGGEA